MIDHREVPMPYDWNDHPGWDQYYQFQIAQAQRSHCDLEIGSIPIGALPNLTEDMKAQGFRSVWIPGCGLSPLPHLLAHLGLHVLATDISPIAVRFHHDEADRFSCLKSERAPPDPAGSLAVEVHDFRSTFRQEEFDLIINVKAFQGFSFSDMQRIAGVHAKALRKGRHAYFDTMNVQGEQRDELEQALENAGFVVPLSQLNRWYHRALRATGIDYTIILGHPVVPWTGEYEGGGPARERDMACLREISAEYESRLEIEEEAEQRRIGPDTKLAQIIYSTG